MLAEGVGFEPTIRFPVYTLSKRAPSATRPSLREGARPKPAHPRLRTQAAHLKSARTIVAGGGVATRSQPPGTARRRLLDLSTIVAENRPPPDQVRGRHFG